MHRLWSFVDHGAPSLSESLADGVLAGRAVVLRPATEADVDTLVAIRRTPEVAERWGSTDIEGDVRDGLDEPDVTVLVIEHDETVVGSIQWGEEDDSDYEHASVDIYLAPSVHGRGLGTDAVRTLVSHLLERGHHRITIDPAADNEAAIRCYERVGFKRVGVLRDYERFDGGAWHDGLLMDLLVGDFVGHDDQMG